MAFYEHWTGGRGGKVFLLLWALTLGDSSPYAHCQPGVNTMTLGTPEGETSEFSQLCRLSVPLSKAWCGRMLHRGSLLEVAILFTWDSESRASANDQVQESLHQKNEEVIKT